MSSIAAYSSVNLFLSALTGIPVMFPVTSVSSAFALRIALFALMWTGHSWVHMNLVPIWTPSAPRIRAAATPLPSPIPPAAATGILTLTAKDMHEDSIYKSLITKLEVTVLS
jgi:hypothetical protein